MYIWSILLKSFRFFNDLNYTLAASIKETTSVMSDALTNLSMSRIF